VAGAGVKRLEEARDPVAAYAEKVLAGRIIAGEFVRLACERHLRDMQEGAARGLRFSLPHALRGLRFFHFLRHSKGEWAGQRFVPGLWQAFIIGSIYGWRRADGTRRFRRAYVTVARKNGKSTLAAGVGLKELTDEDEYGGEVYCVATKKDQASVVFDEAHKMVEQSAALRKRIRLLTYALIDHRLGARMKALGADANTLDGLNVSCGIVDELHAHADRRVWDLIVTATGARRQPLVLAITTAGDDIHGICYEQHTYASQILRGVLEDDSVFGYIAAPDPEDDWRDEAIWAKGNPNLDVSVKLETLKSEAQQASLLPAAVDTFKRLRLNIWTRGIKRWLDLDVWAFGNEAIEADSLRGRVCFAGLDLSATTDLTAFVLLFPPMHPDERWKCLARFFMPEKNVGRRVELDAVPYDVWIRQGFIQATPGNIVDYEFVKAQIIADAEAYDLQEVAFDRWNATQLVTQLLDEGVRMVPFGQGFYSMAAPCREFEKMVVGGQLQHGGNPVLAWNAANVAVKMDPAGNRKPDKAASTERIDGIVALLMAIGRAIVHQEDATPQITLL
jgi:phage terminase large subunit-like protein